MTCHSNNSDLSLMCDYLELFIFFGLSVGYDKRICNIQQMKRKYFEKLCNSIASKD